MVSRANFKKTKSKRHADLLAFAKDKNRPLASTTTLLNQNVNSHYYHSLTTELAKAERQRHAPNGVNTVASVS